MTKDQIIDEYEKLKENAINYLSEKVKQFCIENNLKFSAGMGGWSLFENIPEIVKHYKETETELIYTTLDIQNNRGYRDKIKNERLNNISINFISILDEGKELGNYFIKGYNLLIWCKDYPYSKN